MGVQPEPCARHARPPQSAFLYTNAVTVEDYDARTTRTARRRRPPPPVLRAAGRAVPHLSGTVAAALASVLACQVICARAGEF